MRIQVSVQIREPRLLLAVLLILAGLLTSMPLAAQAISGQKSFSSPLEAVKNLMDAARSGDPAQLVPIIGPQAADLISSGDLGAAKQVLANFVEEAYEEKHSISSEAQGFEFLQVGKGDWPFPISDRARRHGVVFRH